MKGALASGRVDPGRLSTVFRRSSRGGGDEGANRRDAGDAASSVGSSLNRSVHADALGMDAADAEALALAVAAAIPVSAVLVGTPDALGAEFKLRGAVQTKARAEGYQALAAGWSLPLEPETLAWLRGAAPVELASLLDVPLRVAAVAAATPETGATLRTSLELERLLGIAASAKDGRDWILLLGLRRGDPEPDPRCLALAVVLAEAQVRRWGTERKRRCLEIEFRALVDGMRDVLWRATPELVFTYVSGAAEELIGHPPSDLVGHSLYDFLHPETREMVRRRWLEIGDGHGTLPRDPFELPMLHREGRIVWCEVVWVTQLGPGGELLGFQGITRDISARKQAECERVELVAQLHQAIKMEAIGRLAGGIAHDFNNLLMGILGNLELIADELGPEHGVAPQLADAQLAAESAASLTRQLLGFSRRPTSAQPLTDPNRVVAGLRQLVSRLIGEDVTVAWHLDPEPGQVRMDPVQLEQVVVNLLVNSRDAMPHGGRIRVDTRRVRFEPGPERPAAADQEDYVCISVTDSGVGMDDATRQRVFEPFFSTKPHGRGTGLGLATTYGAVRQVGGFIEVTSAPGCGATFAVYLPVGAGEPEIRPPVPVSAPPPSRLTTILIVEDDQVVRGVTSRIVERLGYAVLTAATAEQALSLLGSPGVWVELVMTDLALPGMSGFRLAEQIAELSPATRVLYTSGHLPDEVRRKGVTDLESSFIAKPYTPRALAERLHALLRGSQVAR